MGVVPGLLQALEDGKCGMFGKKRSMADSKVTCLKSPRPPFTARASSTGRWSTLDSLHDGA